MPPRVLASGPKPCGLGQNPTGAIIDRFHCHAIKKSKTIQWIKSRNCDLIGNT